MLTISAIPALQDNYIWALHNQTHAIVVDPGEAAPALSFLHQQRLQLAAILCTHRHGDHIGGIAELRGVYNVPVYGRSHPRNPHITHPLQEGDKLQLPALEMALDIWEIPGHLDDHLAYVGPGLLFCGDVMFGAGCGKNFEGDVALLYHSLQRIATLPDSTLIYCAHEYTGYNLPFASLCEPDNPQIRQREQDLKALQAQDLPSVPSTLALEKATNPFIRCDSPELIQTLRQHGLSATDGLSVFKALRAWRDHF